MKCSRVERILPLSVGDELEGRRKREIEEHLAGCEGCRLLKEDLLRSRAWIASIPAPPLGEAESGELRRGVWREIESRGLGAGGGAVPRYRRFAVASAGGLLVAVLVGLAVLSKGHSGPAASPPAAAVQVAPEETVVAVAPPRTVEESAAPEPVPAKARPIRARAGRHTGAVPSEVVKIEFQTANPDVRIIWLVKKGAETPSAAGRNQEVS